jgi:surface antigen
VKAIGATLGFLLVALLSVPVLFASSGTNAAAAPGGSSSSGSTAITSLAPLFPDVPAGGWPGHERFASGNCTWWAAYNRQVTWNGNGAEWLLNAAAQGYATSGIPQYEAIAVYPAGPAYAQYGHVALVIAVTPTSYTVSEMNYRGLGVVDQRTIPWPDPQVEGFIL